MRNIRKYWFILVFVFTLAVPLYGKLLDNNIVLKGVTSSVDAVEANTVTLGDGSYQIYLNNLWEDLFPGKKFLLTVRNQLLYSVCRVSPNSNVVIGKDGYLFEPAYILFETQAYAPSSEEYFTTLGNKLSELKKLLEGNGKELYVFITPSKAHFFKEYIPDSYIFLDNEAAYSYTNYSKLLEELNKNKIHYYDSIAFIEENIDSGILDSPLFYRSGIHWSQAWGETCAANFLEYINEHSTYNLGSVSVKESLSNNPISPASDLYSSLNLIFPPDEQWYSSDVTIDEEGADKPNIFLRGGSFMGQSLNALVRSGLFGKDVHFENSYYFTDCYAFSYTLSGFSAYDELDINQLVGQSDILVLEVNEGAIHTMSWGFIEYLLEHPSYLDCDTEHSEDMGAGQGWYNYTIELFDSRNTEYNPWGYTAGIIDFDDNQQCVLLNPNTSFEINNLDGTNRIALQTQIHPWVADASDGAGIVVWIMNDAGDILQEDTLYISNTDEWVDINLELSDIENASRVKFLCNNGQNDNDDADWVIFRVTE